MCEFGDRNPPIITLDEEVLGSHRGGRHFAESDVSLDAAAL